MHLETLESRQLRSVTVIEGYPGYYEVHGDDSDDVIAIDFTPDGSFTLDGATYGGVSYISIYSYGGDDTISVGAGPTYVGASVESGSGNDVVTLNVAGAVWAGPGSDTVRLTDSFRGLVYAGQGDDQVSVAGESPDVFIDGEEGSDLIEAAGNNYGIIARGGKGEDTVYGSNFDDQIYGDQGNDLLLGNGGNDIFYCVDLQADRVLGGAGVDTAYADPTEAGLWGVEYVFYV